MYFAVLINEVAILPAAGRQYLCSFLVGFVPGMDDEEHGFLIQEMKQQAHPIIMNIICDSIWERKVYMLHKKCIRRCKFKWE